MPWPDDHGRGISLGGIEPLSVIDTLTLAFNRVARHIWLVAVPVLLDLFLWLGPKVSVRPIVEYVVASLSANLALGAAESQTMDQMLALMQSSVAQVNYMSLLSWGGQLGLPSIAGLQPLSWHPTQLIEIQTAGQMALAWLVLLAAGLLLACVFLAMLAQDVRAERVAQAQFARRMPRYWVRMLAVLVPLGAMVFASVSAWTFMGFLAMFMTVLLICLLIFLAFFPQAITLGEARPLEALWTSFAIVRMNLGATLGLLFLSFVIETGLALVWNQLLALSAAGTVAAILLNAYVGTSLTMAMFLFYRDRMIRWHEAVRQRSQAQ
jgi:hypothetical protein